MIKDGHLSRDFAVNDIYGNPIKLSEFRGNKVLLSFYRNVGCPFCNMRAHQLKMLKPKLDEVGFKMIWVFESTSEKLLASTFHQRISPIPLIGDPEHKLFDLYNVKPSVVKMMRTYLAPGTMKTYTNGKKLGLPPIDKDATMSMIPADFLINKFLFVEKAYYGRHMNDHIEIDEIKKFAGIK